MKAIHTAKLIDLENLREAAECLRTLAHPVRLRMVQLMLRGELTVGEIAEACEIPSHMASEHLRSASTPAKRPRIYSHETTP